MDQALVPSQKLYFAPSHPQPGSVQRRGSYASVDSTHSSYQSMSSMRRSPSMPLQDQSRQRVVAVVDQQFVVPDRRRQYSEPSERSGDANITSQRHRTNSESAKRPRRRHAYEQVRPAHPYETMVETMNNESLSLTPTQDDMTLPDKPISKWRGGSLMRNRPKSSPAPKRSMNASDSKLHRISKKGPSNSPAMVKRHSAGNVLEENKAGKEAQSRVLKQRMSSPEGQLHAQMLNRYFPTSAAETPHEASQEQVF